MPIVQKKIKLTWKEVIYLIRGYIACIIFFPLIVLKTLDRDPAKSRSFAHELRNIYGYFRSKRFTTRQLQYLAPTTEEVVKKQCKKSGVSLSSENVKYGDVIHWIGNKSSKKVILLIPGGGFGFPAYAGHVQFMIENQTKLRNRGKDTALAIVEYGLTPQVRYPVTYRRMVECVRHVINKGFDPSDIILIGDSAGANAILAVFSHILHPLSAIAPLHPSHPFAGICLISPWVTFDMDSSSWSADANIARDFELNRDHMWWLTNTFITESDKSPYSEPLDAEASWWNKLPVKNVLVICGKDELMADDVKWFAEKFEEGIKGKGDEKDAKEGKEVEFKFVACENELHIECFNDYEWGLAPGRMALEVWRWCEEVC